jgi:hypothetical protein
MALVFAQFLAVAPTARAASSIPLVISEVNWGGASVASPDDQWIEIKNTGVSSLNFLTTPVRLEVDRGTGTPCTPGVDCEALVALNNSTFDTINAGSHFVLGRKATVGTTVLIPNPVSATDNSRYIALNGIASFGNVTLPAATGVIYYLVDIATGDVIDSAAISGMKGRSATSSMPAASATRTFTTGVAADGMMESSWETSITNGAYLVNTTNQLGTPGATNTQLQVPMASITPTGSVQQPATATLTGTAPGITTAGTHRALIEITRVLPNATANQFATSIDATGAFSYDLSALLPGKYRFSVAIYDAIDNSSDPYMVKTGVTGMAMDYLVIPATSTLAAPSVPVFPAITNMPSVTLDAMVAAGTTSVEVLVNGEFSVSIPVTGTVVQVPLTLLPNQMNAITLVAANETEISTATQVVITHDSIAPAALMIPQTSVKSNPPGIADTISGLAGSAEPGSKIYVYRDAARTMLVAGPITVAMDGSFTATSIGDNLYATVYAVAVDAAGNISAPIALANPVTNAGIVKNIVLESASQNGLVVTWTPLAGSVNYTVRYKENGSSAAPVSVVLCAGGSSCPARASLINLKADTAYMVSVAAIDTFGNVTVYTDATLRTAVVPAATVVPVVPASPEQPVTETSTTPVASTRYFPAPAAAVTPASTPTPSPTVSPTPAVETGEVAAATTEARNWTPWIILAVLALLAVIAAVGYFYWFGGDAGASVLMGGSEKKDDPDKRW